MKAETHFAPETGVRRPASTRVAGLAAALVTLGLLGAFWETALSVEAIWRRSETFAHGYVVIPITLWLIWRRRDALAALPVRPCWPALGLVALFGFGWMLGNLSSVLGLEQFSLLFMIIAGIVAVVGLPIAREIAFPLAFLIFAIPVGEFLVPLLIDRTADATIVALRATGVPVFREGNHFSIPSGQWSVVEACSGIRYLIASLMVGTLYAYLSYRSARKRALFVLASIIVPIVANWMRAYMIVMIGHLSGNRLAVGIDHIIYGWIFFGVVVLIMFWIGSRWREDQELPAAKPGQQAAALATSAPRTTPVALAVIAALALGIGWRPLGAALDARTQAAAAELPAVTGAAGWQTASPPQTVWTPHFVGPQSELHQWFTKDGQVVGLYVALYNRQTQGHELIGSQNQLVTPSDKRWAQVADGRRAIEWGGTPITARTAEIAGGPDPLAARSWYWVDGRFTSSDTIAKALLAVAKISLDPDYSAVIVIYTPKTNPAARGERALDAFSRDMAAAVMNALHAATAG
ncbi:MAG: exosortase A [Burkholderiales bacterium]|nr:exosortase A [Burkholderiales bacterium]